jgi:hypothetical protein
LGAFTKAEDASKAYEVFTKNNFGEFYRENKKGVIYGTK